MYKNDFHAHIDNILTLDDYQKWDIKDLYDRCDKDDAACQVQEELESAKEKMSMELEQKIRLEVQREETEKNRKQGKADTTPVKPFLFDTVSFGDKTYDSR